MKNKALIFVTIYLILNLIIVIVPQSEIVIQNRKLLKNVSQNTEVLEIGYTTQNEFEILDCIQKLLESRDFENQNYTYRKDTQKLTVSYNISMEMEGSIESIKKFAQEISLIEGLRISDMKLIQADEKVKSQFDIIIIGAKK